MIYLGNQKIIVGGTEGFLLITFNMDYKTYKIVYKLLGIQLYNMLLNATLTFLQTQVKNLKIQYFDQKNQIKDNEF